MRVRLRSVGVLGLSLALAACGSTPAKEWALLPAGILMASDAGYLNASMLAAGVIFYVVSDPFAPNWSIEEARQGDDRYLLALRLKAIHSGGDGEARQVFKRRAAQLAGQPGFASYEVISWQEGLESTRPFAQRVAFGELRLVRAEPSPGVPVR
ncbi:hypothetical protein [Zoogloea sp. LCSB751]|uniref:hypothetical protein n=1 Tax=Zoogloea sp. LCSB751 TaxID=1965277 RepID=UPI001115C791|nr:hypothetical protein [Zoogloea sp. LCSB751]